ncbi:unnamed protein product [Blepharisma stoltei]|uniref:Uncharacterized protein n=1 Tax=Blepharisma stoltei TaxID=1481888 RepID=A0AAU9JJG2_9CILI|nr:unnamed protein product [Blepharisma stoltei]
MYDETTASSGSGVLKESEDNIIAQNKQAMELLRKEKYDHALFFLNQALINVRSLKKSDIKDKLLAITYNNLGCFFRRTGKQQQALDYLFKAADLEKAKKAEVGDVASTHLNICVILSEKGEHERALRHALKSLYILRGSYPAIPYLLTSLGIAYHNAGIEYEYLNQTKDAMDCFKKGFDLCKIKLGLDNEITKALKKSYEDARKEVNSCKTSGQASSVTSGAADSPRAKSAKRFRSQSQEASQTSYKRPVKFKFKTSPESYKVPNRHLLPHVDMSMSAEKTPKRASTKSPPKSRKNTSHQPKRSNPLAPLNYSSGSPKQIEMNAIRQNLPKFEEIRTKTPAPGKVVRKRIDAIKHHQQENLAASIIQNWWKNLLKKRKEFEESLKLKIRNAEMRARKALEEAEQLKQLAEKKKMKSFKSLLKVPFKEEEKAKNDSKMRPLREEEKAKNDLKKSPIKEETKKSPLKEEEKVKSGILKLPLNKEEKTKNIVIKSPLKEEEKAKSLIKKSPDKKTPFKKSKSVTIVGLQAWIRMFLQRRRFKKLKNAAITIQKNLRRYQCSRLYKEIKAAVIYIQRFFRMIKRKVLFDSRIKIFK